MMNETVDSRMSSIMLIEMSFASGEYDGFSSVRYIFLRRLSCGFGAEVSISRLPEPRPLLSTVGRFCRCTPPSVVSSSY